VGEHDDLGPELPAGRVADAVRHVGQQAVPGLLPSVVHDHGREVEVHLVAGRDEVVDGRDPLGDGRRPHVHDARRLGRHQAEPQPGAALRVVSE
jgi:hypothetical protein